MNEQTDHNAKPNRIGAFRGMAQLSVGIALVYALLRGCYPDMPDNWYVHYADVAAGVVILLVFVGLLIPVVPKRWLE